MNYELKELCFLVSDSISCDEASSVSYVSTESMIPNRGGISISSSLPKSGNVRKFRKGDILISNIRPYFKKIWKSNFDGTCSNDVLVIRSNGMCDSDYLYYLLSTDDFFNYMMATSKGTKMPRGDKTAIMNFEIELPSDNEQKKVSSVLNAIDAQILTLTKINDYLPKSNTFLRRLSLRFTNAWIVSPFFTYSMCSGFTISLNFRKS